MVRLFIGILAFGMVAASPADRKARQLVTCPGIAGFCSESLPGDTCLVVCAFGRNNVPECQADGTWTDLPRCIEHEPGIPEQVPGICPGIPGYCSLEYSGGLCEFQCASGPDIRSFCTPDGTWDPYPTCDGDIRETKDGCDPCPGPFGGPRDRSAERAASTSPVVAPASSPAAAPAPASNERRFSNPVQPAARPRQQSNRRANPRKNNGNRNNNKSSGAPAVIQPARQSGFSSAPRPASAFNSRNKRPRTINNPPPPASSPFPSKPRNNVAASFPPRPPPQQPANNGFASFGSSSTSNKAFTSPRFSPPPSSSSSNAPSGSRCPGEALEVCIDVCPSFTARIFGACVAGCARRCPNKK